MCIRDSDSAAALRAIEIDADVLVKGTKVDGVYTAYPVKDPRAVRYDRLSFDRVINDKLNVMDTTAVVMCRENHVPIRVFNLNGAGELVRLARGENIGTLVTD